MRFRGVLATGLAASVGAAAVAAPAESPNSIVPQLPADGQQGALAPPNATSEFDFSLLPPLDVQLHGLSSNKPILYAVSTCSAYHTTRAKAVYETWCSGIESCLFYSDDDNPSMQPPTIKISIEAHKELDGLQEAQMRYMRILGHAIGMINENAHGHFAKNKWLVIADDDSYIFHHNMLTYLNALDSTREHYTGHTLRSDAYPVDSDGDGDTLTTQIRTRFACGGGGSVFSNAAVKRLHSTVGHCITEGLPGNKMWRWQSDWMMGMCAHEAGVPLLNQPPGRFGQFLYRPSDLAHLLVTDPGKKHFCETDGGVCKQPVSIHPVKEPSGQHDVEKHTRGSAKELVRNIKPVLHMDGSISFEDPN